MLTDLQEALGADQMRWRCSSKTLFLAFVDDTGRRFIGSHGSTILVTHACV